MFFSKSFDPRTDVVDLKGKIVIVTGGNRGIGYGTIKHLARAGAKVYMGARSESSATDAIQRLKKEGLEPGNGEIVWLKLDLSDPRHSKKAAEEFLQKEKRLDVLVNNAGALIDFPFGIGNDGISDMIVINHISPFVFTKTLLPLLKSTAQEKDSDVRIVNLTSIMHKMIPSDAKFDELKDLNLEYKTSLMPASMRYGYSKLMNVLFTKSLQKRLDASQDPIAVIAVHPGGVDTFSHKWPMSTLLTPLVRLAINDIDKGSYTSVFAASSKKVREDKAKYKGAYLESHPPGHFATPSKQAQDPGLAEKLWVLTERFAQEIGCE